MTQSTPDIVEPTRPCPPRFWWLKRIGGGLAVAVAIVFILRAVAVFRAEREFNSEIATLKARGEPVDLDLSHTNRSGESSAITPLERACEEIEKRQRQTPESTYMLSHLGSLKDDANRPHDPVLMLVRRARLAPEAAPGPRLKGTFEHDIAELHDVVLMASIIATSRHKPEEFANYRQDLNAVYRILDHETFWGFAGILEYDLTGRTPSLSLPLIDSPDDQKALAQYASLRDDLPDERQVRTAAKHAVAYARAAMIHNEEQRDFEPDRYVRYKRDPMNRFLFRAPAIRQMTSKLLDLDDTEQAADAVSYPIGTVDRLRYRSEPRDAKRPGGLPESPQDLLDLEFRYLAHRRALATAVAIRLYQADHHGNLPTILSDLVPAYLKEVPADPFSSAGASLRYRSGVDGGVVYSIGLNRIDDGGLNPVDQVIPLWVDQPRGLIDN